MFELFYLENRLLFCFEASTDSIGFEWGFALFWVFFSNPQAFQTSFSPYKEKSCNDISCNRWHRGSAQRVTFCLLQRVCATVSQAPPDGQCSCDVCVWISVLESTHACRSNRSTFAHPSVQFCAQSCDGLVFQRHSCSRSQFWFERHSEDCHRQHILVGPLFLGQGISTLTRTFHQETQRR